MGTPFDYPLSSCLTPHFGCGLIAILIRSRPTGERRGVLEYWMVDWRTQPVEMYRREQLALHLVAIPHATDTLASPLLPGFACQVATLF